MNKEILHKYAEDNYCKIIHIDIAVTKVNYYCPNCKDKFILKKGKIRQHHFSHNNLSPNCTLEGYLHKTFKKMLLEKISYNLRNNLPIRIEWKCGVCNKGHNTDLLNEIFDVKDEYFLGPCRPDIALLNKNGNVPFVIEIVGKHEPEETALKFYKENKIILIKININTIDDLDSLENKIKNPSSVEYHISLCPKYESSKKSVRFVQIIDIEAIKRKVRSERSRRRF